MFNNIPEELRLLRSWVLWRYDRLENGKTTKIPYSVKGFKASVTDPSTWCSFEEACAAAPQYSGIGFVLQKSYGYTIIDLDNKPENPATEEQLKRHQKIYQSFNSYTELSVSKTGVHIIVRGTVPAGSNKDHVEVYSDQRYMACTGNIIRAQPVQDYQSLLDVLFQEMQIADRVELEDREEQLDDRDIVDMAMRASNANKFNSLCRGEWKDEYESQSEADFALLSIIAFYTANNEQVRRIFRMSNLGKREKAIRNNTYLDFALSKIRAHQPTAIDMAQAKANAEAMINSMSKPESPAVIEAPPSAQAPQPAPIESPPSVGFTLPPGLVGELAQYFYSTAVRPVQEIALASAIALTAGVAGRSYNISGTGLNQYIIILAQTGSGKEGAASGIENIFSAVRPTIPMIDIFQGPAAFASGQALAKHLVEKPCFLSVLGEFGLTLQQISDSRANSAEKMLKKVLLDIYGKSGNTRMLQSSVYSDVEKNTFAVRAPNVTILGESTPETFFEGMSASHIAEGLIPRFTIVEYTGGRPPRNRKAGIPPSKELIQRFGDLCVSSITNNNNNVCNQVQLDEEAQAHMDNFDTVADTHMNGNKDIVELQLWNRAHLKALKIAALIAVGINPHKPVITAPTAAWAIDFVTRDITGIHNRFKRGDVGMGDSKQQSDLVRAIETYYKLDAESAKKYGAPEILFSARIIPYQYLIRKCSAMASFRLDRLGSTGALKKTLQSFLDAGMLMEVSKPTLLNSYKYSGVGYVIGTAW